MVDINIKSEHSHVDINIKSEHSHSFKHLLTYMEGDRRHHSELYILHFKI
jgi:hypothetical protein